MNEIIIKYKEDVFLENITVHSDATYIKLFEQIPKQLELRFLPLISLTSFMFEGGGDHIFISSQAIYRIYLIRSQCCTILKLFLPPMLFPVDFYV